MEREFVVADGRSEDFYRTYGPSGLWNGLLSRAAGFVSTRAWCESEIEHRFRTEDVWLSHVHFEDFRRQEQAECEKVTRFAADEGIVEREILLGAFYDDGPDEAGLVTT